MWGEQSAPARVRDGISYSAAVIVPRLDVPSNRIPMRGDR